MDVAGFYAILAGLSFTLLGLWWVACQSRMAWIQDGVGRGMAYVVSLHFALPGAMALLSLIAPDVPAMWRITFTVAGALGLIGTLFVVATMRRHAALDLGLLRVIQWVAIPLYAGVAVVAAFPQLVGGIGLTPIQVEAILLVVLVLLGTQSAWVLTFARDGAGTGSD
ncbi:MAG TPA: hypothetical protein VIH24_00090 [Candidatus Limnocylindria bacterium]